jgi:hypothetical protein
MGDCGALGFKKSLELFEKLKFDLIVSLGLLVSKSNGPPYFIRLIIVLKFDHICNLKEYADNSNL